IHRFKPERSPEHFRRLREAFESLDEQLESQELYKSRQSARRLEDSEDVTEGKDVRRPIDDESNVARSKNQTRSPVDPVIRVYRNITDPSLLWDQVLAGVSLTEFYTQMSELSNRRSLSEIDYARLYWAVTLQPQLDTNRDPTTW